MGRLLRIHLLDILRGISVVAMIVYHFFWDLGYFNFFEIERITQGLPLLIAQCIGASFLIIAGISFGLSKNSNKFISQFFTRLSTLVIISSIITFVTFLVDRNSFIFFGILHLLAACSIISFLLIRVKNNNILFFLFIFSIILNFSDLTYDFPRYISWLGFNKEVPITNDFYPLFPWVSFYLFGLWVCEPFKFYHKKYFENSIIYHYQTSYIYKSLQFLGKNSLPIYILHQPIFFSLFLIFIGLSS